ncbi:uncharacterized protein LOC134193513 [Corticium candelabrum]|uniref:uncharacterized protein LOC134193513 n=1 Tax=Corticium candelabrum TaxID=121492 RepID=UPI002E25FE76|nr:uncharacterized protein LOC134193513 [Corticium candelabrum]
MAVGGAVVEGPWPLHFLENFQFPKRQFGKKEIVSRSLQSSWFKLQFRLHYDEARDVAFCHSCIKACKEKKLAAAAGIFDQSFIRKGFCYWKNVTEKLKTHEASNVHRKVVEKTISLPKTTEDVGELLSRLHKQDKCERRQCFLKIVSCVRFLARQGLPLRG